MRRQGKVPANRNAGHPAKTKGVSKMKNETTNAAITLDTAAPYFAALGEAGSAVLYKICQPEASPADIAAALGQKLDKEGKPRSTDIRISGISQLIQAGFIVTATIPEGGLKPVTVKRSCENAATAIAAAKAEAEAAALATVTEAAYTVLTATNGNREALAGMPESAVSAAMERWTAAQIAKRNAANANAAALLNKCAAAAGVEAAALLEWIEAKKAEAAETETKKQKKA